jgi:hypothetical protein
MYMASMRLKGVRRISGLDSTYFAHYDPAHAFNLLLSLRGGRPNAAFYGYISYPLPYIFEDDDPDNYLLEFSAFGVFGGKRVKAGLGITGNYKRREADFIRHDILTYEYEPRARDTWNADPEYYEYSLRRVYEYTLLVPALKVAGLLGEHVVLGLTFELRGTILPRFADSGDSWQPSIGFDVVYSLGALKGANVMDGTF